MVLALLASRFGPGAARGTPGLIRRFAPGFAAGLGGAFVGERAFGEEGGRRRRRRKALTNDDVRTALTIASAISKKAAENFILMRVRGQ